MKVGDIINNRKIIKLTKRRGTVKCLICGKTTTLSLEDLKKSPTCLNCLKLGLVKKETNIEYNIGDVINNLEIIGYSKEYPDKRKCRDGLLYICQCLKDGYVVYLPKYKLIRGDGCPLCSNHIVVPGINDIWTTNVSLGNLLANPEDGFKYTQNSNKKVWFECPNCGKKELHQINYINRKVVFPCPICGDGFSYPEKFMLSLLDFLKIPAERQKKFPWSQNFIFDFYLNDKNIIIECHGEQHYRNIEYFNRNKKFSQIEKDNIKRELVKNQKINYIELDCSKSEFNYIKKSLIDSNVFELLEIKEKDIDWKQVLYRIEKSKAKMSANLWENGKTAKEISNILNINITTVRKYLRRFQNEDLLKRHYP